MRLGTRYTMMETVYWEGSGSESGMLEKMSKVVDSVLQCRQVSDERICP